MEIHIRSQIEYEKIIPNDWPHAIQCTRSRMCVQQLLDSQYSQEHLKKRLFEYIAHTDIMFNHMAQNPTGSLRFQPTFEWTIDDQLIQSSCWRIENILPRLSLTRILTHEAYDQLENETYKEANKVFVETNKYHLEIQHQLENWKWKIQTLNHDELQSDWHESRRHFLEGLQQLCTLCVGVQNQVNTKVLYTVSQRALKCFALSVGGWHNSEAVHFLPLADCLRHYFSADLLWSEEKYGHSIYRLEKWCTNKDISCGKFKALQVELEKVPFLLQERNHINNGAYFEPIESAEPLPSTLEIMK